MPKVDRMGENCMYILFYTFYKICLIMTGWKIEHTQLGFNCNSFFVSYILNTCTYTKIMLPMFQNLQFKF